MSRIPQILITLAPDGRLVAELPGANGMRRQVPVESLGTIRRMLGAQLAQPASSIGTTGAPTTGQVIHWERHQTAAPDCPWCMAASMGIDVSERAHVRSQRALRQQRAANSFHRVGDGSVKVRVLPPRGRRGTKSASPFVSSLVDLIHAYAKEK